MLARDSPSELTYAGGDLFARDEHPAEALGHGLAGAAGAAYLGATNAARERSPRTRSAIRWASTLLLKVPMRTR